MNEELTNDLIAVIWPLLCERCNTPMRTIRASGSSGRDDGTGKAIGWCDKCNALTWTKPFKLDKLEAQPNKDA